LLPLNAFEGTFFKAICFLFQIQRWDEKKLFDRLRSNFIIEAIHIFFGWEMGGGGFFLVSRFRISLKFSTRMKICPQDIKLELGLRTTFIL
jgi:hypothetical protein